MTEASVPPPVWVNRAVERSAAVRRSQLRVAQQVRQIMHAARTLIEERGDEFTTADLAAQAGVALQTFYRYFASKDELLLALIGDAMREVCEQWVVKAEALPDPLARLRYYLMSTLERLDSDNRNAAMSRFVVSARWRLHRQFPTELAEAERPFVELVRATVCAAVDAGQLSPTDPEWDSWFLGELMRSVYHYYAFVDHADTELEHVKQRLWQFILAALGGRTDTEKGAVQ